MHQEFAILWMGIIAVAAQLWLVSVWEFVVRVAPPWISKGRGVDEPSGTGNNIVERRSRPRSE
jgi:hypothetical protein